MKTTLDRLAPVSAKDVMQAAFLQAGYTGAEAAEEGVKAEAVEFLAREIKSRGWTQSEFGKMMGWTQSTVSGLLRGDLEDYSIKRINKALAVFGAEIETKVVNTLKLPPAQHAAE